jgi:hypothetical protein
VSGNASDCEQFLRNNGGIPSGPGDLLISKFVNTFNTSEDVILRDPKLTDRVLLVTELALLRIEYTWEK